MKKIKVAYSDFWAGFEDENNFISNVLSKDYEIEISKNPDFVFYSCFGAEHKKYENCVKIFLTGENVVPDFNECDYATGFHYINFEDRYLRYNFLFYLEEKRQNPTDEQLDKLCKRKFCNFLYSNSNYKWTKVREDFFRRLSKYKHIDSPGKSCHNLDIDVSDKYGFIKDYKFTIAFENSNSAGYTTEKLSQPFSVFSVPIYWGNKRIGEDINSKAFVNCNDYDNNFDRVIERIIELDLDDEKYKAMLLEQPILSGSSLVAEKSSEMFRKFLINIIEKGNAPLIKDPNGWASTKLLLKSLQKTKKRKFFKFPWG